MLTIAIVSQKGGAGKTTLALHLAAAAEEAGQCAVVIDLDQQATACQWAAWRGELAPEVIDSAPPRLGAKIAAVAALGAEVVVIDTPPHADQAAAAAVAMADLVFVPCRPSGFDLAAIQTTAGLVRAHGKRAFAVFSGGSPNAPRLYEDAGVAVASFGLGVVPFIVADRAVFRHATGQGRTVMELDPHGKASQEIRSLYKWACQQVTMQKKDNAA